MSELINQISIRKFCEQDIIPLTEIIRSTNVFKPQEIDVAVELMQIALDKDQKDYIIYTCESKNTVLGYYCVGPTPMTESTFDLYWIAVDPKVQGKKIGHTLLMHCEELVKKMGCKLIVAETSSQEKYKNTRNFYLKNNYIEAATIKNYYSVNDDLIIYTKNF